MRGSGSGARPVDRTRGGRETATAGRGTRAVRQRLDRLLVDRGLAPSRERAQALILAGVVRVDGRPAGKPGTLVAADAALQRVGADHPFVGRGGVKLEGAIATCRVEVAGRVAVDIGASTGGFTDCLLKRGALRVYARHLAADDLPEPVGLAVIDVSFISLRLILPPLPPLLAPGADVLALVKPQFEVGRGEVGRGGIVRSPEKHLNALRAVAAAAGTAGFRIRGACASSLPGAEGNREFFLHLACAAEETLTGAALEELLGGIVHDR